jgi:hypothetical protein
MIGPFSKCVALGVVAAGGMVVACGPSLSLYSPEGAFDTAHDVAKNAEVAQADMPSCLQADGGSQNCDRLNKDLCTILKNAIAVERAAMDAGYQPQDGTVSTLPATCSNK